MAEWAKHTIFKEIIKQAGTIPSFFRECNTLYVNNVLNRAGVKSGAYNINNGVIVVRTEHGDLFTQRGLHAEVVAQTKIGEVSDIIINPANSLDPQLNPRFAQVLEIYKHHYLGGDGAIEGEGESEDVVKSRLRGEDPNVKAVTVYAMRDDSKVGGMAFVETYEIDETKPDGSKVQGLTHLITYAAAEPPYDKHPLTAAFHASLVDKIKEIDHTLGFDNQSVIISEVNSFRGYDGKPTSDKMDVEFELKTGLKRAEREAYQLEGSPAILKMEGDFNNINILQIPYIPPALDDGDGQSLAGLTEPAERAAKIRNQEIQDGTGEPLFLTAETTDGRKFENYHLDLQKAFMTKLYVSVGRDLGLSADEVTEAMAHKASGLGSYNSATGMLERQLGGGDPVKYRIKEGSKLWLPNSGL